MSVPQPKTFAKILGGGGTGLAAGAFSLNAMDIDCFASFPDRASYVAVNVIASALDNVAHTPQVLKITQGDTTDTSNHTNILGCLGGTDFVIGGTTGSENVYVFNIDTRAKSRYLKVTYSPNCTQEVVIVAHLFRLHEAPGQVAADFGPATQNVINA